MTFSPDIGQIVDHKLFVSGSPTPPPATVLTTNGIQGDGSFASPVRLNIPGLPDQLTYDPTMTVAVRNPTTGQHEEILASLLVPAINKYTPAGIITDANTNPAFPVAPTVGDAREITTTDGTVGGLPVTVGDLLVFGLSGWFVLQGDSYTASNGIEIVSDDIRLNVDNLALLPTPIVATDEIIVNRAGQEYRIDVTDLLNNDQVIQKGQSVSPAGILNPVFYNSAGNQREIATENTRTPQGIGISSTQVILFGRYTGTFTAADVGRFVYLNDTGGLYAHPTDNKTKIGYIKSTTEMIIDIEKESYGNFSYHPQRLAFNNVSYAPFSNNVLISKKRKYQGYFPAHFSTNNLHIINTKTLVNTPIAMGIDANGMCEVESHDYLIVTSRFSGVFRVLDIKTQTFIGGSYPVAGPSNPNPGFVNSVAWISKQNAICFAAGDNLYWYRLSVPFGGDPFDITAASSGYSSGADRIRDKQICYHETSNQLFVPNSNVATVTVFDCETRTINATISNGQTNNKVVREKTTDLLMLTTRGTGYVMHPTKYGLTVIPGVFGAYGAGVSLNRKQFIYCGTFPDVTYFVDPRSATVVTSYGGQIGSCNADSCKFTNRDFRVNNNVGRYSTTE